jgi:hypothetical protein
MYDSDVASDIPTDAKVAAGYVDGSGTYPELVKIRPNAKHLSISIHGAKAKCYDMENGALAVKSGVAAAKRDIDAGDEWPWLYYSVSRRKAVIAECKRQGINGKVIHWGAHYGVADILPRGYHALQNVAPGYGATGHWDRSILADFIPGFDVKPTPKPSGLSPATSGIVRLCHASTRHLTKALNERNRPLKAHAKTRLRGLSTAIAALAKAIDRALAL